MRRCFRFPALGTLIFASLAFSGCPILFGVTAIPCQVDTECPTDQTCVGAAVDKNGVCEDGERAAADAMANAETRKAAIEAMGVIEITARVGSEGKLFGSVGVADICDAIETLGGDVQKSELRMPEGALRTVGEHIVDVHLYTDIDTRITVNIVGEE